MNDDDVFIGATNTADSNGFDGKIDDVQIYNRAISRSEIAYAMLLPEVEDNKFTIGLTDGKSMWAARFTDRSTVDLTTVDATSVKTGKDVFKSLLGIPTYEHAKVKTGSDTGMYKLNLESKTLDSKMEYFAQTKNAWMPPLKKLITAGSDLVPSGDGGDLRLVGYLGGRGKQRVRIETLQITVDTKKTDCGKYDSLRTVPARSCAFCWRQRPHQECARGRRCTRYRLWCRSNHIIRIRSAPQRCTRIVF